LKNSLQEKDTELKKLQCQLSESTKNGEKLKKENEKMDKDLKDLQKSHKCLSQELMLSKSDTSRLNNECIELRRKLEFRDQELSKLKSMEKQHLDEVGTLKQKVAQA
jgi:chromosome segregation ATPase